MEASVENNRSITVTPSPPCVTAIIPCKKRPSRIRRLASCCVFWIGIALIGVIALPAGVLFSIICLIARTTDILTAKLERN